MMYLRLLAILLVTVTLAFTACGGGGSTPVPFDAADTPGDAVSITVGSETVDMIYANNQTSIIFPFSPSGSPVDNNPATLTRKFFMSQTQVTNALMAEVLQWAYNNGKFSTTVGNHNGLDSTTAKYGTQQLLDLDDVNIKINYSAGSFTVDSGFEDHPVVCVTWYGAIMFCNWLTEMRDGNTDNCVYNEPDTPWVDTQTTETAANTGYRLPSSQEWEFAARYIGTTAPTGGNIATEYVAQSLRLGHATLTAGYCWTPAAYASGGTGAYDSGSDGVNQHNYDHFSPFAWYGLSTTEPTGNTITTQPVGLKAENALGLHDMSGNVMEWCFTASDLNRVHRGGSWGNSAASLRVGYWIDIGPHLERPYIGFRFARSQ